jgi:hypothetical protein
MDAHCETSLSVQTCRSQSVTGKPRSAPLPDTSLPNRVARARLMPAAHARSILWDFNLRSEPAAPTFSRLSTMSGAEQAGRVSAANRGQLRQRMEKHKADSVFFREPLFHVELRPPAGAAADCRRTCAAWHPVSLGRNSRIQSAFDRT